MSGIKGIWNEVKTARARRPFSCLGLLALLCLPAAPASAQNTRSWVSGVGTDANPCSRTAPCLTFTGAIAKTNAGGEINCLDSGSFGGFNIATSLSIICEGVVGGVLVTGGDAIIINAGAADVVVLRGLDIEGSGAALHGVNFVAGAALHVENCRIRDFSAIFGWGIQFSPGAAAELYVTDTTISHNGLPADGGGIRILATAGTTSKVVINQSNVQNNTTGIKADGVNSGAGGVISVTIRDTASVGNTQNGIVGTTNAGGSVAVIMVNRSAASHNAAGFGIIADGPKTFITFGASSIAGNANGVGVSNGGTLLSWGTNQIYGNSVDGTPTLIGLK